jgi:hypothetical protein
VKFKFIKGEHFYVHTSLKLHYEYQYIFTTSVQIKPTNVTDVAGDDNETHFAFLKKESHVGLLLAVAVSKLAK